MSLTAIADLTGNSDFGGRVIACVTQQAEIFKDDARPDFVALAHGALRGETDKQAAFWRITAAAPGLSDQAGDPPDQTLISDGAILSTVQANWQTVAALYYDPEGAPL